MTFYLLLPAVLKHLPMSLFLLTPMSKETAPKVCEPIFMTKNKNKKKSPSRLELSPGL